MFPVEPNHIKLNDLYSPGDEGKTRESVIAGHYTNTEYQVSAFGKEMIKENVYEFVHNCDFIVCCFDKGFVAANYWANEACAEYEKPIIFSEIKTNISRIGPLVIPGQTACYMCYKMRSFAAMDDFDNVMSFEEYYNKRKKPDLAGHSILPGAINYNASILFNELIKFVFSINSPTLASRILDFNFFELKSDTNMILQNPDCKVCSKKKSLDRIYWNKEDLAFKALFTSQLLNYKNLIVNSKTGIIRNFVPFHKDLSEPVIPFIFRADISNHRFAKKKDKSDDSCSGKGLTIEQAEISALGEAVERYSGECYDKGEIVYAPFNKLDGKKLDPERLVLFAQDQYSNVSFAPFDRDNVIGWARGFSLLTDKYIYVPAVAVFMGYEMQSPEENICQITSNGLAAGASMLKAILSAFSGNYRAGSVYHSMA